MALCAWNPACPWPQEPLKLLNCTSWDSAGYSTGAGVYYELLVLNVDEPKLYLLHGSHGTGGHTTRVVADLCGSEGSSRGGKV